MSTMPRVMVMRIDAPFWATLVACALAASSAGMLLVAARAAGLVG